MLNHTYVNESNSMTSSLNETSSMTSYSDEMSSTTSYLNGMNNTTSYVDKTLSSTPSSINETMYSGASYNETAHAGIVLPYISTGARTVGVIGIFANIFTIIVMVQKKIRKMAVSRLLIVLAVSDSICLFFNSSLLNGVEIITTLNGCRVYFWFRFTFAVVSHWLIVIIAGERLVAVCFFRQANQINTIRNGNIAMGGVFSAAGVFVLVEVLQWSGVNGACIFENINGASGKMARIYGLVYIFLPVPLLITMNTVTAVALCCKGGKMKKEHRNLTIMLLLITALFILLVLPGCLAFSKIVVASKQVKEVTQLILTFNYAVNFFIYVMVGSRFRENIVEMFRKSNALSPELPMRKTQSSRLTSRSGQSEHLRNSMATNSHSVNNL